VLVYLSQRSAAEKMVRTAAVMTCRRSEKFTDFKTLGGGKAAKGHAVPLPQPLQPPDRCRSRHRGAAADRPNRSNAQARYQDVRAPFPGEPMEKTLDGRKAKSKGSCET